MKFYTDQEQVEGFLKRELSADEQTTIELAISAATDYIEKYTHRQFRVDDVDDVRYYSGGIRDLYSTTVGQQDVMRGVLGAYSMPSGFTGLRDLSVEPMDSITTIEAVDATNTTQIVYVENQDYYLVPRGRKPILNIHRSNGYWPKGIDNIKITGKWGEVLPDSIRLVATKLVGLAIQNLQGIRRESLEGYDVQYYGLDEIKKADWAIDQTLDNYIRVLI